MYQEPNSWFFFPPQICPSHSLLPLKPMLQPSWLLSCSSNTADVFLHWDSWTSSFLCRANTLLMYSCGPLAHFLRFLLKRHLICHVHLPKLSPSLTIQYKRETLHPCLVLHVPFRLCLKLFQWLPASLSVVHGTKTYLLFIPYSWHEAPKSLAISWEIGVPLSVVAEFMLMRWLRWEPLESFRMSLVQKGQVLRGLELSALPTDLQVRARGAVDWAL